MLWCSIGPSRVIPRHSSFLPACRGCPGPDPRCWWRLASLKAVVVAGLCPQPFAPEVQALGRYQGAARDKGVMLKRGKYYGGARRRTVLMAPTCLAEAGVYLVRSLPSPSPPNVAALQRGRSPQQCHTGVRTVSEPPPAPWVLDGQGDRLRWNWARTPG